MDNIARGVLKSKLSGLKGTGFQDAVDRIFLIINDSSEYVRVKQKRDQGSDGILNNNTVLAVYAPEAYSLSNFKRKIKIDYESYEKNWSETHNSWLVVTNLESTSAMIKYVDRLKNGSNIMCIERLLEHINEQTWTKKSAIFEALDIPNRYLSNDVLAVLVDDLIKQSGNNVDFQPYEKPTYIETKIDLNVTEEHRQMFLDEYEEGLPLFPILQHVIQINDSNSVSAIRSKIRKSYIELSGTFLENFNSMVESFSGSKVQDDYYNYHMRIVLVYFFEQCLFGNKTNQEGNS